MKRRNEPSERSRALVGVAPESGDQFTSSSEYCQVPFVSSTPSTARPYVCPDVPTTPTSATASETLNVAVVSSGVCSTGTRPAENVGGSAGSTAIVGPAAVVASVPCVAVTLGVNVPVAA